MDTPRPASSTIPALNIDEARAVMNCALRYGRIVYFAGQYFYDVPDVRMTFGPYLTAGRALTDGYMDACCRQTLQQIEPQ